MCNCQKLVVRFGYSIGYLYAVVLDYCYRMMTPPKSVKPLNLNVLSSTLGSDAEN